MFATVCDSSEFLFNFVQKEHVYGCIELCLCNMFKYFREIALHIFAFTDIKTDSHSVGIKCVMVSVIYLVKISAVIYVTMVVLLLTPSFPNGQISTFLLYRNIYLLFKMGAGVC
jgi:hypothetical protein